MEVLIDFIINILSNLFRIVWSSYSTYTDQQINVIISILVAILTGGFLMLFIENQHVATSVRERYRFIMQPFYHKLTNYFRFVSCFKSYMSVLDTKGEYVNDFSKLIEKISRLAYPTIMSGKDYPISYFDAETLYHICSDINQIWWLWDRKHNYFEKCISFDSKRPHLFLEHDNQYLHEVSDKYDGKEWDMSLLMKVSGDFFSNDWQPIKHVPFHYEHWEKISSRFSSLSVTSILLSLFSLTLILILRYVIPVWIFTVLTMSSIIILSLTVIEILKLNKVSTKLFE